MKAVNAFLLGLFALIAADQAFAMGKAPTGPNLPGGSDSTIDQIAESLRLNPYVAALQKEFKAAGKPIVARGEGAFAIDDRIEMNHRYDCRIFYALAKKEPSIPYEGRSWYEFQRFGDLFIDNLAFMDNARIKTFAVSPKLENEVWGQAQDTDYYEAIRVNDKGDLLIESFVPQAAWAELALGIIGVDSLIKQLGPKVNGLALATTIANAQGNILSYTYCPRVVRK